MIRVDPEAVRPLLEGVKRNDADAKSGLAALLFYVARSIAHRFGSPELREEAYAQLLLGLARGIDKLVNGKSVPCEFIPNYLVLWMKGELRHVKQEYVDQDSHSVVRTVSSYDQLEYADTREKLSITEVHSKVINLRVAGMEWQDIRKELKVSKVQLEVIQHDLRAGFPQTGTGSRLTRRVKVA